MPNSETPTVLIISYYWPPSSGSGVQRWMYFAKYLSDCGVTPLVLTVDPSKASYRKIDEEFSDFVKDVKVYKTKTLEPLKLYSMLTTGSTKKGIPQGSVGAEKNGLFSKISRYVRGNIFIPDARIGWKLYAVKAANKIITNNNIDLIITTGPPHSTHLIGRVLKRKYGIKWIADFRDPWTEIYYNQDLLQSKKSKEKDGKLELSVLNEADRVLTVGPSMADLLMDKIPSQKSKFSFIYNGYDAKKMISVQSQKSNKYMTISYIGLLTDAMPHSTISESLKLFVQQNKGANIKVRLAGDICTSFLDSIQSIMPPNQIEILGYIPHREALNVMKSSDILFTCLPTQDHSKIMISGKMLEYIASGNSILCIGNQESDAAKMIQNNAAGIVLSPSQIIEAKEFYIEKYNLWQSGKLDTNNNLEIQSLTRYNTTKELATLIKKLISKEK